VSLSRLVRLDCGGGKFNFYKSKYFQLPFELLIVILFGPNGIVPSISNIDIVISKC